MRAAERSRQIVEMPRIQERIQRKAPPVGGDRAPGTDGMRPSAIQLQVIFLDLFQGVTKDPMRTIERKRKDIRHL